MTDPTDGLDLDALERLCAQREALIRRPDHGASVTWNGLNKSLANLMPQALATIRALQNTVANLEDDVQRLGSELAERDGDVVELREEVRQLKASYDIVEKRCIDRGHKLAAARARVAELEEAAAARTACYEATIKRLDARIAELEAERSEMIEALRRLVCRLIPGMMTPSERNAIDLVTRIAPEVDLGLPADAEGK